GNLHRPARFLPDAILTPYDRSSEEALRALGVPARQTTSGFVGERCGALRYHPAAPPRRPQMADTRALLYLLQVANGSFPTGSFAHCYGLETLIQEGRITDARGLTDVAQLWLRYGVATSEGGAVGIAFRATRENDFTKLAALDEALTALKLTRETREASVK